MILNSFWAKEISFSRPSSLTLDSLKNKKEKQNVSDKSKKSESDFELFMAKFDVKTEKANQKNEEVFPFEVEQYLYSIKELGDSKNGSSSKIIHIFSYDQYLSNIGHYLQNKRNLERFYHKSSEIEFEIIPFKDGNMVMNDDTTFFICPQGKQQCEMNAMFSCISHIFKGSNSIRL